MKKTIKTIALLLIGGSMTWAQTPEQKGLKIAQDASKYDEGFESSEVNLTMTLKNKHGQESVRFLSNQTLELIEDGDKSLIVFNSPRDVKGTATLTYTHKEVSDDQWLYLPSIKRVKRISSDNKSGPFMGSEFAYEDLSSQEVEKYTYKYIKDDNINGENAYVIERDPVDPKSGYTRQLVWLNKSNYRPEKIEFYDRKDELLKTLSYANYKVYLGKHWRAGEFLMVNHQTGKETTLKFEDYRFKVGLAEADFSQNSLIRAGR
ncbi:MAG: outer membrane lipoprotein-sorting protein [Reichenbachiella sp.]|uniref:outer membrane lipoprotein-sorting protein n=1 Tax=Reichenbachiella sp. TaxID=2184521 RepID=UPI00329A7533